MSAGLVTKTVRTDAAGREQRRRSHKGRSHAPDLRKWYRYHLPPLHPGDFTFELHLLRPDREPLPIDHLVDTLSWDDETNVLTGSVSIHRPVPDDPTSLPIYRGQLLRCRVRWAGRKYELWTMRVLSPQTELDTATVTATLQDDLALLKADVRDWLFRKTKARKFGYTCDEIARLVAKRVGLKVGELAKGKKRQSIVKRGASAYDVLFAAYMEEHKASQRDFIIRIRNGALEVVTLRRNPLVYVLGEQMQTALIAQKSGPKAPPTVLTGRATIGKGHGAKKISYTEYDRRVVARLGYVHAHKNFGTVSSHGELREKVKRDLARGLRLNHKVTVTHAGIPFILRGDGVDVDLPREGYKDERAFMWCSRANHTVQGGTYTTDFDFTPKDLYLAAKKAAQRSARKNVAGGGTGSVIAVRVSLEDASSGDGWTELSTNGYGAATAGHAKDPNCGPGASGCDFATLGQAYPHGTQLIISKPDGSASAQAGLTDVGNGSSFAPAIGITPALAARLGGVASGETLHIQLASGGSLTVASGFGTVVKP